MMLRANCSCDLHPHVMEVFGLEICNLPIVGAWLGAVVIALYCGIKLVRLGPSVNGSLSYSLSYFTYGLMISSGLIVHCIYLVECTGGKPKEPWTLFAKLDGSLTSCVAISFLFNGLIDANIVVERHFTTYIAMLFNYSWIFYCYFISNRHENFQNGYFISVAFGCGSYIIIEIILIIKEKFWKESLFLIPASVVGGGCLLMIRYYSSWLCQQFGAWSIQGLWYYGADISMAFLFLFVWFTRKLSNNVDTNEKNALKELI